jgi:uncharacterized protein YgiM (DUF1202 family)
MRQFRIFLLVVSVLLVAATVWSASGKMSVQVRRSELRDSPSFLGSRVAPVVYGEQVEVVGQQGNWMEVSASSGTKGWIHQSALTKKRIAFSSGAEDAETGVSGEELALAGKGFNADVEKEFRDCHPELDFTWVDEMEQMKVSPQEVGSFFSEGDLQRQAGGVK